MKHVLILLPWVVSKDVFILWGKCSLRTKSRRNVILVDKKRNVYITKIKNLFPVERVIKYQAHLIFVTDIC